MSFNESSTVSFEVGYYYLFYNRPSVEMCDETMSFSRLYGFFQHLLIFIHVYFMLELVKR